MLIPNEAEKQGTLGLVPALLVVWGSTCYNIHDDAKKMIKGKFNRSLKEAPCHLQQTEQFTPWLNAAEKEM